jgi:hypothetical protein
MKKIIIIVIIAVLVIIGIISGVLYYKSFHKISFTLSSNVSEATIYLTDTAPVNDELSGREIQKITSSSTISLQNGKYYITPKGSHIITEPIPFVVEDAEKTISIDPNFTSDYLSSIALKELLNVQKTITKTFPEVSAKYTIANGSLFGKGEWYGGVLTQQDGGESSDFYRFIAKKENNSWKIIRTPMLALTKSQFPSVPTEILSSINKINL